MSNKLVILLLVASCWLLVSVPSVLAQKATEYQLLAPIPLDGAGSAPTKTTTAVPYITGIFTLIIAIAGGLAVIKIIFGGIKYMSTDAFTDKNEAKDTIQNAIWGLVLAISAWLILYTVNPNLVKFDLTIPPQPIATGSSVRAESTSGGLGGTTLTKQQALDAFKGKIEVAGSIELAGIRQSIVDELIQLKDKCNCEVIVTSATGGEHERQLCSHANGYKVDLRNKAGGIALNRYIFDNYKQLPDRSDGAKVYKSPTGALYALEPSHWDVAVC